MATDASDIPADVHKKLQLLESRTID